MSMNKVLSEFYVNEVLVGGGYILHDNESIICSEAVIDFIPSFLFLLPREEKYFSFRHPVGNGQLIGYYIYLSGTLYMENTHIYMKDCVFGKCLVDVVEKPTLMLVGGGICE